MSLSFDGVDDFVTLATAALGTQRSFCMWINPTSQGESSSGRLFAHNPVFEGRNILRWDGSAGSKKLRFTVDWTGSNGSWTMTSGFTTLAVWHFVAVTYDGGASVNDPTIYVSEGNVLSTLTVGSGLTEDTGPSGAEENADSAVLNVGSYTTAGDFAYAGLIGEVSAWASRLLTAAEVSAIFANGPMTIPGMYLYWPMDNTGSAQATDLSGNARNGTPTNGPTAAENPPIRCAGRR